MLQVVQRQRFKKLFYRHSRFFQLCFELWSYLQIELLQTTLIPVTGPKSFNGVGMVEPITEGLSLISENQLPWLVFFWHKTASRRLEDRVPHITMVGQENRLMFTSLHN
jgi:hypothetical protein